MKIYLAGKVPKGDESIDYIDWRRHYTEGLAHEQSYVFLTPLNDKLDYGNPISVFGHDCHLIKQADIIIVDGSRKLGVGTAQEMVIAKYFNKYVLSVVPKNTHHRKPIKNFDKKSVIEDWIHPFIYSFSDKIFDHANDCIRYLKKHSGCKSLPNVKTISTINDSITIYLEDNKELI